MELNLGPLALVDLCEDVERAFRPVAEQNGLEFRIERDHALPPALVTDEQRLQQVLRNLLSNAFKFTQRGHGDAAHRPDEAGDGRLRGDRHRHRHPRRQAVADLRGLPAGRRHDVAQVRRHRPGPLDLARDRPPAGRRAARAVDAGRGLDLHARAAAGRRAPPTDAADRADRARRRCPASPADEQQVASLLPFDGADDDRTSIVAGDRVLLIIAHDAELAARRARRGARAELPLPRRPPRAARAWRSPASTAPRRCSSSPPTAAARSCSASSSSTPRPATARSSWPARPAGGCRPCAPAPPGTSRARAAPRPSPTWPRRWTTFNARAVAPPGAHRGRDRARPGDDDAARRRRGRRRRQDALRQRARARCAARARTAWCCRCPTAATRPSRCSSRRRPTTACASCRSSSTPPSRSRAATARAWIS